MNNTPSLLFDFLKTMHRAKATAPSGSQMLLSPTRGAVLKNTMLLLLLATGSCADLFGSTPVCYSGFVAFAMCAPLWQHS